MAQLVDATTLYLLQPSAVFLAVIIVWFVQSLAVLYVSRRWIFPQLYRFKTTEWLIAEVAIAIHELSHLVSVVLTGSKVDIKESFLTSKAGRIAARHEESIGGWISSIIAAFAPAFVSSSVFFASVVLLTQVQLPFASIFSFQQTGTILIDGLNVAAVDIILPFISALMSVILQLNLASLVLIYFLIVLSITAGPSEGDWQAAMSLLFSLGSLLPIYLVFLIANYVLAQFGIDFLLPLATAMMLSIAIVALGLAFALALSAILYIIAVAMKRHRGHETFLNQ